MLQKDWVAFVQIEEASSRHLISQTGTANLIPALSLW